MFEVFVCVWVLLRERVSVCVCVCVWSVCQSATFLQCWAPFDFPSLSLSPLSPPPPLLLFSASSLCLYPRCILLSPLFSFIPACLSSSIPSSYHHFTFSLSCPSSSSQSSSSLLFPITFISSHHLSFPLFTFSRLILSREFSLYSYSHWSILFIQSNPLDQ